MRLREATPKEEVAMGNTSVLPPLAKQARISRDVVIDKTGSVVEMKGVEI